MVSRLVAASTLVNAKFGSRIDRDTIRYDLVTDGKSVVNIEWHGSLAARDRLRQCLSAAKK